MTDIEKVLEEREKTYGDFATHAEITCSIKLIMETAPSWGKCSASQKEALSMIAHKIGRIVNGDPSYKDSWTDIIGYAKLVEDKL
jgi:Domain of unknown function (DUF6378)